MSAPRLEAMGPDLTLGLATGTLADGKMLAGHVGEDAVLLARHGNEFFAIGATCTHYNGPLAEGLMVDDTVRCPWHHACFSLRTGEAVRAPALGPVACWSTELRDGKVFVRERAAPAPGRRVAPAPGSPQKIVVIGGGAAGFAATEMLRRQHRRRCARGRSRRRQQGRLRPAAAGDRRRAGATAATRHGPAPRAHPANAR
jgi:nitrite reductase/ring-hydroxylating ferredoxin subunit